MSELREIVLCKDCIHRPTIIECEDNVKDNIEFPDKKCPCQCEDDWWYSWYPDDNFYCARGEESKMSSKPVNSEKLIPVDKNKREVIKEMFNLLNYAKDCPAFNVCFDVVASTENIEKYISERVQRTDWEGKPLSEDDIKRDIEYSINQFRNSDDFNAFSDGMSKIRMSKIFTLQEITFDKIRNIMYGECKNMPTDYMFCNSFILPNKNQIISDYEI